MVLDNDSSPQQTLYRIQLYALYTPEPWSNEHRGRRFTYIQVLDLVARRFQVHGTRIIHLHTTEVDIGFLLIEQDVELLRSRDFV